MASQINQNNALCDKMLTAVDCMSNTKAVRQAEKIEFFSLAMRVYGDPLPATKLAIDMVDFTDEDYKDRDIRIHVVRSCPSAFRQAYDFVNANSSAGPVKPSHIRRQSGEVKASAKSRSKQQSGGQR